MGRRNLADLRGALPLIVAAGTALAAFAFLAVAGARSSIPGAVPAPPPPVSVRRPPAGLVTRVSGVQHLPVRTTRSIPGPTQSLAWGGGRVWSPGIGGVVRITPGNLAVSSVFQYVGTCGDSVVAYGAGGIWVTGGECGGPGMVLEFDRRTRLRRTIKLPAAAVGIGVWNGRIWVTTDSRQGSRSAVVRIDPRRGTATLVGGWFDGHGDPAAGYGEGSVIPLGGGRFWTVANDGGVALMMRLPTGRIDGVVEHGQATPEGLALGDGAMWAGLNLDVERLDPLTGVSAGTTLRPRSSPVAVAFGQGTVWIATSGYEVYGFRPGSKSMTQVARLPFVPATMIDADGYLWATDGQTLARIGPLPAGA